MKKVLKAVGIITAGIVGVITLSVLILMSSDNWYNYCLLYTSDAADE